VFGAANPTLDVCLKQKRAHTMLTSFVLILTFSGMECGGNGIFAKTENKKKTGQTNTVLNTPITKKN
jgi:hypothetical protein